MTDELDRFRAVWQESADASASESGEREAMAALVRDVALLGHSQRRRDLREIAIAAGAAGVLAITLPWAAEPWLRAWILILSASAALIAVWKFVSLSRRRSRAPGDSIAAFCRTELEKLNTEIRLQRTLPWWYLTPILVGTNLYVLIASSGSASEMTVFLPISLAIIAAIAWATRRSLRKELLPRQSALISCLSELAADTDALSLPRGES